MDVQGSSHRHAHCSGYGIGVVSHSAGTGMGSHFASTRCEPARKPGTGVNARISLRRPNGIQDALVGPNCQPELGSIGGRFHSGERTGSCAIPVPKDRGHLQMDPSGLRTEYREDTDLPPIVRKYAVALDGG